MKIGILGSAFDPITNAHLAVAKYIMREKNLDKVIFVPSSDKRCDKGRKLTPDTHRWNMLKLALQNQPGFEVNDIEMRAPDEKYYTYYTLEHFRCEYPDDDVYFIIGADILGDIPKWHRPEELLKDNKLIVVSRDDINIGKIIESDQLLNKYSEKFDAIESGLNLKISSTFIREQIKKGINPRELIPKKCYKYIFKNELYGSNKKQEEIYMRKGRQDILDFLKVSPTIVAKEEIRKRIDFLKEYLRSNPSIESLVLGLSGGQDSTLCGKLSQMAINELNEEVGFEKYKFIGVRLPYGVQKDEADCQLAIDFIKPDAVFTVNIKPSVDASVKSFFDATGEDMGALLKGNEKARERMKVQYSLAGKYCGLVVGTDHASEAIMGFYTKQGDGAADILPISNLNKRQGAELLRKLHAPEIFMTKAPDAGLEDNGPATPDETVFGVKYNKIDDYTEGREVEEEICDRIERIYDQTAHKRNSAITIFDL